MKKLEEINNVIIADMVENNDDEYSNVNEELKSRCWIMFCFRNNINKNDNEIKKLYYKIFNELNSDEEPVGFKESLKLLGLN